MRRRALWLAGLLVGLALLSGAWLVVRHLALPDEDTFKRRIEGADTGQELRARLGPPAGALPSNGGTQLMWQFRTGHAVFHIAADDSCEESDWFEEPPLLERLRRRLGL